MANKRFLGVRTVTAVNDPTGNNSGNWTAVFDPQTLDTQLMVEAFKIVITTQTAQFNVQFTVNINQALWDFSFLPGGQTVGGNTWNGEMPIRPGQFVYFYFQEQSGDGTPPTVAMWLRYDPDLPQNKNIQH